MSGVAGRINYSDWEKKTTTLLSTLDSEEKAEEEAAKAALGQDGKYAYSEAEAKERAKAEEVAKAKKVLDDYKKRETSVVQNLVGLLNSDDSANDGSSNFTSTTTSTCADANNNTRFITRENMGAGKRVLNISDTSGPGHIIVTQDLTNLQSQIPTNTTLTPKSYPEDAENDVTAAVADDNTGDITTAFPPTPTPTPASSFTAGSASSSSTTATIHGLIKINLTNLNDCTISINCKVITGILEVSHCSNLVLKLNKYSTIVTIQADLCQNLSIQFHDAPSGTSLSKASKSFGKNMFWGEDKDDRIYHAGVSNLDVKLYRNGIIHHQTKADYKQDGAVQIGNATAEEVQFITSVVKNELLTERVLSQGSATGTTVAGGVGGGDGSGGGARAMTAREMQEIELRKEQIRKAVDSRLGGVAGIKIMDKQGNEVLPKTTTTDNNTQETKCPSEHKDGSSSSPSSSDVDIECIVKDCEAQKTKGNEAFVSGEYAQAVLLYTLALDKAAELPDKHGRGNGNGPNSRMETKQLFPRHIVLSNRSASFLKLGHHDKALADATEAERIEPTYVKGVFRKGLALHAMGRYQDAIVPLAAALKIEPKNKQIKQALQFAEVRMQQLMRKRMEG